MGTMQCNEAKMKAAAKFVTTCDYAHTTLAYRSWKNFSNIWQWSGL